MILITAELNKAPLLKMQGTFSHYETSRQCLAYIGPKNICSIFQLVDNDNTGNLLISPLGAYLFLIFRGWGLIRGGRSRGL